MLAVHVEIAHALAAESVLERLCDVLRADPHQVGLVAVDGDARLGLAELQVGVGHLEDGALVDPLHEFGQHLLQAVDCRGLEHVLHGHVAAPPAEGRLLLYEGAGLGLRADGCRELLGDLHLAARASGQAVEGDADVAPPARHAGRDGHGLRDERIDQQVDVLRVVAHVFVGGALRACGVDRDPRTVLERGHLRGDRAPEPADQTEGDGDERQGQPAAAQEGREGAAVEVVEPDEEGFGAGVEPVFTLLAHEQLGGEHRRDGERREGRDQHGARDDEAELAEQAPGRALHEDDREEDGDQRDRGRDHGEEDLLRSVDTRLEGGHAAFDADVDVLGHHDGIVYHKADREHHGQHREDVDREAGQVHQEEGADERDRDDDARDERHAPVAEEEEDDDEQALEEAKKYDIVDNVLVRNTMLQISFNSLISGIEQGDYIIPGFQRFYRWKEEQVENLAISFIRGMPIPPVYCYRNKKHQLVILDGQQRILSLYLYYKGQYFKRKRNVSADLRSVEEIDNSIPKMLENYEMKEK